MSEETSSAGPTVELSGKGVIGTGFSDLCKAVGKQLTEQHNATFERDQNRIADEQARATQGRQEYFVSVERLPNGFIKIETIDDLPFVGKLGAIGRSWESACAELRFGYAYSLKKEGFLNSLEDARRHACRAEFKPDLGQSKSIIRP